MTRHPVALLSGLRPVLLVLGLTLVLVALSGPVDASSGRAVPAQGDELLARGEQLYLTGCSSCHGAEGGGVVAEDGDRRGPSLRSSGAAAAFYVLSTGRMPLADPDDQSQRKDPAYDEDEIEALVAYVSTLGDGPAIPDVDLRAADLAEGGTLYRANCQACHSAFGSGGALSYGYSAPSVHDATPTEIGAAVRVGPGLMPVFNESVLDERELNAVAAYIGYLESPANPGGLQIGRNGPVPEGFVAWIIGIGGLLLLVLWVGGVTHIGDEEEHAGG